MDSFLYGRARRHAPYYPAGGYGGMGRAPVLELLVPMCCAKCEEKVYEELMELRGVQGVMVDRQEQRVIVHGFVDPLKALKKAKKVKRDSQLWSGQQYDRDFFSSSKYRRSAYQYQSPSIYRTSSLEYRPPLHRSSLYDHLQPSSVYRTSYNRYTPSYGQVAYGAHQAWPVYDDGYSHVVTNPYYMKHIESDYY